MYCRRLWRWKNSLLSSSVDLAVLLIALSCELDDFYAVVYTKENVAAKALADQINDLSPPTQSTFGRLLGRIEEGKGEAYATKIDVRCSDRNRSHCGEAYSDCDWRISYCGNGHEIFIIQPMAFQGVASVYGGKPAVRQLSRNRCICCHPTAGTYRICRGPQANTRGPIQRKSCGSK